MEEELVRILFERALKITTAESCTGGLIAATLVNVPGVSDVFETGYITYSEETKMRILGVKRETLEKYTVYSEEVAREMAEGAAKTPDFPVGLCYIGCYYNGEAVVEKHIFQGDRQNIRAQAVDAALELAIKTLD